MTTKTPVERWVEIKVDDLINQIVRRYPEWSYDSAASMVKEAAERHYVKTMLENRRGARPPLPGFFHLRINLWERLGPIFQIADIARENRAWELIKRLFPSADAGGPPRSDETEPESHGCGGFPGVRGAALAGRFRRQSRHS
jgi:hypothetical protein